MKLRKDGAPSSVVWNGRASFPIEMAHPPKNSTDRHCPEANVDTIVSEFNPPYASNLFSAPSCLIISRICYESRERGDRDSNAVVHAHFHGELCNSVSLAEAA